MKPLPHQPAQVPSRFVPGRNGLLLQLASMIAWQVSAETLYLGVLGLESERSGYPDCTREYIDLQEKSFQLDYFNPQFRVIAPLIHLTKQQSYVFAQQWNCLEYLLEETITCYEGIAKNGCKRCPACQLRNHSLREYLKDKPEVQFSYRQEFMNKKY
jgi:7-cyano-7-deazaguanine synthase